MSGTKHLDYTFNNIHLRKKRKLHVDLTRPIFKEERQVDIVSYVTMDPEEISSSLRMNDI